MSWDAVNYVLALPMRRSADKVVLICLANHANDKGISYPCEATIQLNTALDRKTVIAALPRLVEAGLIRDTGLRTGSTHQVKIWELVGVPEISGTHYTYRITDPETGEFYLGKRSCKTSPESDSYMGSGSWPKKAQERGRTLIKHILATHPSSKEALVAERELLDTQGDQPLCRNTETRAKLRARGLAQAAKDRASWLADRYQEGHASFLEWDAHKMAEEGYMFGERVPNSPPKHPVFSAEASRSSVEASRFRDTEPSEEPLMEPSREPSGERARETALPLSGSRSNNSKSSRPQIIAPDWSPNATHRAFAEAHGLVSVLEQSAVRFKANRANRRLRLVDFDADFLENWLPGERKPTEPETRARACVVPDDAPPADPARLAAVRAFVAAEPAFAAIDPAEVERCLACAGTPTLTPGVVCAWARDGYALPDAANLIAGNVAAVGVRPASVLNEIVRRHLSRGAAPCLGKPLRLLRGIAA